MSSKMYGNLLEVYDGLLTVYIIVYMYVNL